MDKEKIKFYKKQEKEILLEGTIKNLENKIKEVEALESVSIGDEADFLWHHKNSLIAKYNKANRKLQKLTNADGLKVEKLNAKLSKSYIKLYNLNNEPRITYNTGLDIMHAFDTLHFEGKVSRLTKKVIKLGGQPVTMEDALKTNKKNANVSAVDKAEIAKLQNNGNASSAPTKERREHKVPSCEKLYEIPVQSQPTEE